MRSNHAIEDDGRRLPGIVPSATILIVNHPLQVMPDLRRSARLPGTPGSRDMQPRTVSAMSETRASPPTSVPSWSGCEARSRSALAGAGWGAKPTRPGAAVAGRQRWRAIVATLCIWGWPPWHR
jgi:hypothetical protein